METHELLARYAELINAHGVDSELALEFYWEHCGNDEFVRLAETAYWLKKAFSEPRK